MPKLYITYPNIQTGHIHMSHVMNGEHPQPSLLSWQKGRPESRVCWRVMECQNNSNDVEYNQHRENNNFVKQISVSTFKCLQYYVCMLFFFCEYFFGFTKSSIVQHAYYSTVIVLMENYLLEVCFEEAILQMKINYKFTQSYKKNK